MADVVSAREVFEGHWQSFLESRWDDLSALVAEDMVMEMPFGLPEPMRVEGRQTIVDQLTAAEDGPLRRNPHIVAIYETTDLEVVVVEIEDTPEVIETGRTFRVFAIEVVRARDGQLVSIRHYYNQVPFAAALGQLDEIVAAMKDAD